MNPTHITIVGAGPIGGTLGTLLAANPNLKVTMIDKRPDPTRTYGLSVRADAIKKTQEVLEEALRTYPEREKEIQECNNLLDGWRGHVVRTNDMENSLKIQAKKLGAKVLRGKNYEVVEGDLEQLLNPEQNGPLTKRQYKLKKIFGRSQLIIAADGSHSTMRMEMGIQKIEKDTINRFMAEFKFQTEGTAQPRGKMEATFAASKVGHVAVEQLNPRQDAEEKPGTLLVFIDQEVYEKLRQKDSKGEMRGIPGKGWTIEEFKAIAKEDPRMASLEKAIDRYIAALEKRGGHCNNATLATLELKIYQSEQSVKDAHGKPVVFVGDSNSGLVLQRGFNEGLKEAALLVEAINRIVENRFQNIDPTRHVPVELIGYEAATRSLFELEESAIAKTDKQIAVAQSTVQFSAAKVQKVEKVVKASSKTCDDMEDTVKKSSVKSGGFFSWLFGFSKGSDL